MALIEASTLRSVVEIGLENAGKTEWLASGFLYGHYLRSVDEKNAEYDCFLVTNKHVFEIVQKKNVETIAVRIQGKDAGVGQIIRLPIFSNREPLWIEHIHGADVATIRILAPLKEQDVQFDMVRSHIDFIGVEAAQSYDMLEGYSVFVIGFPYSIAGVLEYDRAFPIVRSGVIARIQDTYAGMSKTFLVDATVYPGNSGGLVIIKPELTGLKGTPPLRKPLILGMVRGYHLYIEDAYTEHPQKLIRARFIENSGLAIVETYDSIKETVERYRQRYPLEED